MSEIKVRFGKADGRGFLGVILPYDGNRHNDNWVQRQIAPGITLSTFEDGVPVMLEIEFDPSAELRLDVAPR